MSRTCHTGLYLQPVRLAIRKLLRNFPKEQWLSVQLALSCFQKVLHVSTRSCSSNSKLVVLVVLDISRLHFFYFLLLLSPFTFSGSFLQPSIYRGSRAVAPHSLQHQLYPYISSYQYYFLFSYFKCLLESYVRNSLTSCLS